MDLAKKRFLITGGSAGIGKAIIRELVEYNVSHIAVMGRDSQKLEHLEKEFPSVSFLSIRGDVGKPNDLKRAFKSINDNWGSLDVLVNNAGVVSAGLLEEISDEDILNQININVTGLILMTKYFLPLLKQSPEGALVNISSGLGYLGMPFYSVYAATKAAVKHFSEAMRRELYEHPVHVMTVFPTATDTDMMKTTNVENMDTPEEVAKASIEGLRNKEIEVILGGEKRMQQIQTNWQEPLEMDKNVIQQYDSLKARAENHRAM